MYETVILILAFSLPLAYRIGLLPRRYWGIASFLTFIVLASILVFLLEKSRFCVFWSWNSFTEFCILVYFFIPSIKIAFLAFAGAYIGTRIASYYTYRRTIRELVREDSQLWNSAISITCPKCGTLVFSSALYCPKCLSELPKGNFKTKQKPYIIAIP
ncbi:hypothetical protein [Infirmifilum sp.]|uniref:hypothetical protein n=1 Tax=Infirmifilum sp. TaxID=2856575 RepID=UPI003D151915